MAALSLKKPLPVSPKPSLHCRPHRISKSRHESASGLLACYRRTSQATELHDLLLRASPRRAWASPLRLHYYSHQRPKQFYLYTINFYCTSQAA